ncbi:MAG: hypothetical protein ACE5Q3_16640 [Alphaproteobacteria bacterium]
MNDLETVKQDLQQADAMIDVFRESMTGGTEIDMANFNAIIERACRGAMELPPDEASLVRPQLAQLLDRLNDVKHDLEQIEAQHRESDAGADGTGEPAN